MNWKRISQVVNMVSYTPWLLIIWIVLTKAFSVSALISVPRLANHRPRTFQLSFPNVDLHLLKSWQLWNTRWFWNKGTNKPNLIHLLTILTIPGNDLNKRKILCLTICLTKDIKRQIKLSSLTIGYLSHI